MKPGCQELLLHRVAQWCNIDHGADEWRISVLIRKTTGDTDELFDSEVSFDLTKSTNINSTKPVNPFTKKISLIFGGSFRQERYKIGDKPFYRWC